jgi:F1F0 ATPase subunit 2
MRQPLTELSVQNPLLFWPLLLSAVAGMGLGLLFFGSLWWTVQRLPDLKHPAFWFVVGFLLRLSIMLVGLYWLSAGQWPRLLACLAGFLLARMAVCRWTGRNQQGRSHASES